MTPRTLLGATIALSALIASPAVAQTPRAPNLCRAAAGEAALTQVCSKVRYVGRGTYNTLGLLPSGWSVLPAIAAAAEGRDELVQPRHFFAHDRFVLTVRSDSAHHLDMVLRGAAAIESLKATAPRAYEFLTTMEGVTTAPPLSDSARTGRFKTTFISFDRTPTAIAASATLEGPYITLNGSRVYEDYSIISIDEVTIRGATPTEGSRPVYRRTSDSENYRAYMTDGLLYSLAHEGTHRYIDHLSSTNRLAEMMYRARVAAPEATNESKDAVRDAEEIVANETAMSLVGHRISREMREHVRARNLEFVQRPGVREQLARIRAMVSARSALVIPE